MKKVLYSIALSIVLAPSAFADNKSSLSFDSYEWDFGAINAERGTVCHTFTLKNVSKNPVKIGKSIPSCECIKAVYPTVAINPGEVAKVMVAFSPSGASP